MAVGRQRGLGMPLAAGAALRGTRVEACTWKCDARGGARTRTPLRGRDFKSLASAISPPGRASGSYEQAGSPARARRRELRQTVTGHIEASEPPRRHDAIIYMAPLEDSPVVAGWLTVDRA